MSQLYSKGETNRERERERNIKYEDVYFQLVLLAFLWPTTLKVVFMLRYMRKT